MRLPCESVGCIMQDGVVIIGEAERVDLVSCQLVEVVLLAVHNVARNDLHVLVSVGSRMLVPEADDVAELVDDDAELVAVLADADGLRTVASLADEGAATARALGEDDVVAVLFRSTLDELDTGVVFPVTHGRPEEGGAIEREHRVNLVGNHGIVPQAV